jgi:hypothetical protein
MTKKENYELLTANCVTHSKRQNVIPSDCRSCDFSNYELQIATSDLSGRALGLNLQGLDYNLTNHSSDSINHRSDKINHNSNKPEILFNGVNGRREFRDEKIQNQGYSNQI